MLPGQSYERNRWIEDPSRQTPVKEIVLNDEMKRMKEQWRKKQGSK